MNSPRTYVLTIETEQRYGAYSIRTRVDIPLDAEPAAETVALFAQKLEDAQPSLERPSEPTP